ncbi:MAG: restriction endonuclease subunit R [Leptolyngbyaceae cyanobacterium RU_5_1]|nr:restriction endonuclease subunit R [Leptolyngbyaceae cyanobacterium RU_5_1]
MPQLLNASDLSLLDLQSRFDLQRSPDSNFFAELKTDLPPLTDLEITALTRVQHNFLDQLQSRLLIEETVKLVVVSPLLDLAGFYRSPYQIESEVPIQLEIPDGSADIVQGRIDTLVVQRSLWIVLVESKRTQISVHTATPQALAYLLSRPNPDHHPGYALVTNGSEFLFLKQLDHHYAVSNLLSMLNEGNDCDHVLQILKHLAASIRTRL